MLSAQKEDEREPLAVEVQEYYDLCIGKSKPLIISNVSFDLAIFNEQAKLIENKTDVHYQFKDLSSLENFINEWKCDTCKCDGGFSSYGLKSTKTLRRKSLCSAA